MSARFYADLPLRTGDSIVLPAQTSRHVQVLRLQPGDSITLFNGLGDGSAGSEGEFSATIERMGRSDVQVQVGHYTATAREAARAVLLAVAMPANERMDWLVEKATELGVTGIQPLISERSVLRLKGERADKKLAHWAGIAIAACEQSGRNRLPVIHPVQGLAEWLAGLGASDSAITRRLLLSLRGGGQSVESACHSNAALDFLSGPEGGLSPAEEDQALAHGFSAVTLGPRILRAETAALACLALASSGIPSSRQ